MAVTNVPPFIGMVKCKITRLALQNLVGLTFGFNCRNLTDKFVENYIEYLNCPIVDYNFCDTLSDCEPTFETVTCIAVPDLAVSGITGTTAILTFSKPNFDFPYTIEILIGSTVVNTIQNPSSPLTITGLTPSTTYIAQLITHCEFGEDISTQITFATQVICVNFTSLSGTASTTE